MKAITSITAGLLALALVGTGSAQTIVRIAGSTAYRGATLAAIGHILNPGYKYAYVVSKTVTTLSKSSEAIFTGTTHVGNISVIIKTSFAGSVGGVADLTKNLTVGHGGSAYPSGGGGWLVNSTPQSVTGTQITSPTFDAPTTPDVAMSDAYQVSTPFTSPVLSDTIVGVVPFEWVKGVGAATTVTGLTKSTAASLLTTGLSGAIAVGRDEDSGTRLIAFIFAGLKSFGTSPTIAQHLPSFNPPANPLTGAPAPGSVVVGAALWPAVTNIDGFNFAAGHSGYSSGGTLATVLDTPYAASFKTPFIGYLGISDAASVNSGKNGLNGMVSPTARPTLRSANTFSGRMNMCWSGHL